MEFPNSSPNVSFCVSIASPFRLPMSTHFLYWVHKLIYFCVKFLIPSTVYSSLHFERHMIWLYLIMISRPYGTIDTCDFVYHSITAVPVIPCTSSSFLFPYNMYCSNSYIFCFSWSLNLYSITSWHLCLMSKAQCAGERNSSSNWFTLCF